MGRTEQCRCVAERFGPTRWLVSVSASPTRDQAHNISEDNVHQKPTLHVEGQVNVLLVTFNSRNAELSVAYYPLLQEWECP